MSGLVRVLLEAFFVSVFFGFFSLKGILSLFPSESLKSRYSAATWLRVPNVVPIAGEKACAKGVFAAGERNVSVKRGYFFSTIKSRV